jgi:hypothetical protein
VGKKQTGRKEIVAVEANSEIPVGQLQPLERLREKTDVDDVP